MAEKIHRNSLQPGFELHWYRIERILGQGGFGITYLAHDFNLDRQVAIKEYLPIELAVRERDFSVHPVTEGHGEKFRWGLDRFLVEARTLARFRHPNIVLVLNVFEANNTAYMVMGYERGESLQDILSERKVMEEAELINVLIPILGGLQQVHAAGFIHRDIKPANIFIREDASPVLLDFGSARQALGTATQTLTTLVSPGYAPFEQYYSKSDQQGPWTDIYGLGATLYRAVAGVAPMDAVDRSRLILKGGSDGLVSALEVGKGRYSERFLLAIDHALQFKEEDRPQTIAEWRSEFSAAAAPRPLPMPVTGGVRTSATEAPTARATQTVQRPPSPAPGATGAPAERRGMVPLVAAAVIMVVLAVAGVGYYRAQQENAREASLQQMLAGASADLQSGRLVQPQGNNALDRYREVLRLDPGNVAAEQGVRTVAVRLVAASREATAGGRLDAAEQLLGEAVAIWPEVSNAGIAREELNAAQHRLRNRQETKDSALAEGLAALDENDTERALAAMQRAQTAGASVEDLAGLRSRLLDSLNALAAREARDARRALNRKDALAARAALQRARGFKAQAGRLARAH